MTTSELAYYQIEKLIQKFKGMSAVERRKMNENATRQGFILPMFQALGWNTTNINEVSPEEKVSRGWVDFSFRIGGVPLEEGQANEAGALWWEYHTAQPATGDLRVTAVAMDLPGHVAERTEVKHISG